MYNAGTPLWQVPDEPAHVEYACVIAERGVMAGLDARSPDVQQALIRSLAANDFWRWVGRPTPVPLPALFADDPFLRNAGRQIGDESPLSYLLAALTCRLLPVTSRLPASSLALQVHLMRLVTGLFFVLAVLATWWAARGVWPASQTAVVAVTAALAGLPMLAFLSGGVNNDIPAVLLGTIMFGGLARLLRHPGPRWAVLVLLSALLAAFAKKTAVFLLPLALAAVGWWIVGARPAPRARVRRLPGWVLTGLLVGTLLLLAVWPSNHPADWTGHGQPWSGWRTPLAAHSGAYGVRVLDRDPHDFARLVQRVGWQSLPQLAGQTVRLSAWLRAPAGQALRLTLRDDRGTSQTVRTATGTWQSISVTRTLAASTADVLVGVAPGAGRAVSETGVLDVDDVSLQVMSGAPAANLLRNGDLEASPSWGSLLAQPVVQPLTNWLGNPLRVWFGTPAAAPAGWPRSLLYLVLLFPGFWGNFGWLQVPLPLWLYAGLAAVCGLALLGNLSGWLSPQAPAGRGYSSVRKAALWGLAGISMAFIEISLPMLGRDWQPQARYLYPALFPLLAFMVCGLRFWSRRWRLAHGLAWYIAGLMGLDVVCYFGVLLPHYVLR